MPPIYYINHINNSKIAKKIGRSVSECPIVGKSSFTPWRVSYA